MAVVGPTGSGKSALALRVAEAVGAGILSLDSMQVYRGMDIGTAKPTPAQRMRVHHAMVDVVDPETDYSVAEFQSEARRELGAKDGPMLIVGGSGLHFRAVVDPLEFPPTDTDTRAAVEEMNDDALRDELTRHDPNAGEVVDLQNRRRLVRAVEILRLTGRTPSERAADAAARQVRDYRALMPVRIFGVDRRNDEAYAQRLATRVDDMRDQGLLDEVSGLRDRMGRQASQAVGYKELIDVVDGATDVESGFARVTTSTRVLVKRQRTFFRRDPRIEWFDLDRDEARAVAAVAEALTQPEAVNR